MFLRTQTTGGRTYLLLVENERIGSKVRQRIRHRFGRVDDLLASGQIDSLTAGFGRFSEKLLVLGTRECEEALHAQGHRIGGPLVFERLWEATGIRAVLNELLKSRRFGFSVERAVFLTVLHRLLASGSDRAAERWKEQYAIAGVGDLELYQLYRAMAWLGQPLRAHEQAGATRFAPRTTKDVVEERLFARRPSDLFSSLHLVFFDTTSIYFEGAGGDTLGRRGKSKDHRPDLKQMVVGAVLDADGRPICCELWPGNTSDVKTLVPVVERLRTRFRISDVCIVADRGMISEDVQAEIDRQHWGYILGVRMRNLKEVRELLGADDLSAYQEVFPKSERREDPAPLQVREVKVDGRRYILCFNEDQAKKDRYDREAIVASLRDALHQGDTALVGNKGYRRFLTSKGHFEVNDDKIAEEARYDGKWVLTTNEPFSARDTALAYKHLWMVESLFRATKSVLETRPIYHRRDETIRGHVFCSFLALVLRRALDERLEAHGWKLEWNDIVRDLDALQETTLTMNGKGYIVRTDAEGTVGKVFQACGVALPPRVRPC